MVDGVLALFDALKATRDQMLNAAPDCDQWGIKPPGLVGERGNPFVPEAAEEPSLGEEGSGDESGALPLAESSVDEENTHSASEAGSQAGELGDADSYRLTPRASRRGPVEDETRAAVSDRELRSKTNADQNAKRHREEATSPLVEEGEEDEDIFDFGGAGDTPHDTFREAIWASDDDG